MHKTSTTVLGKCIIEHTSNFLKNKYASSKPVNLGGTYECSEVSTQMLH